MGSFVFTMNIMGIIDLPSSTHKDFYPDVPIK